MDRMKAGRWWIMGALLIVLNGFLAGCGSRWSPTDPRVDSTDPATAVVLERWEIGVSYQRTPNPDSIRGDRGT
jgi:hypothetical protein